MIVSDSPRNALVRALKAAISSADRRASRVAKKALDELLAEDGA